MDRVACSWCPNSPPLPPAWEPRRARRASCIFSTSPTLEANRPRVLAELPSASAGAGAARSEERRVEKEGRSRGSPYHLKKKKKKKKKNKKKRTNTGTDPRTHRDAWVA